MLTETGSTLVALKETIRRRLQQGGSLREVQRSGSLDLERSPERSPPSDLARDPLRDPLTDLLNRRALAQTLAVELARAKREGHPVVLAALDVDFFRHTNGLFGHAAGDQLLRAVARQLSAKIRPGDHAARVGPDEFILVLVDTDSERGHEVLGRIQKAVRAVEFGPGHPALSFSAGIAEFPRDSTSTNELVGRADEALGRAKAQGPKQVYSYAPEGATRLSSILEAAERHELHLQNALEALARAVDVRSGYAHLHSHAVAAYAVALARALGKDDEQIDLLRGAAKLHDVGKIGVPDAVLLKEGPLVAEEIALVRRQSATGHDLLLGAGLPEIARWARSMHERPDGEGYPDGLTGEAIPLQSRMLAVVDAFDAMTSPRPYRQQLSDEDALAELESGAGTQFDSNLVARFVALVRAKQIGLRISRPERVGA